MHFLRAGSPSAAIVCVLTLHLAGYGVPSGVPGLTECYTRLRGTPRVLTKPERYLAAPRHKQKAMSYECSFKIAWTNDPRYDFACWRFLSAEDEPFASCDGIHTPIYVEVRVYQCTTCNAYGNNK